MMRVNPSYYPDLLRQRSSAYFEREGLCFAPLPETTPRGECVLAVYFQNRWSGDAVARVQIRPPRSGLRRARLALPAPLIDIECPGGACGVSRLLFPIPIALQGTDVTFEVAADVIYPDGRGHLLRFRAGMPVDSIERFATRAASSSPAAATLTLPNGVSDRVPVRHQPETEMLWRPEPIETAATIRPRVAA